MTHWTDALVSLRACSEAVEWARTQPDLATAWQACERGDWMLWLAARVATDRRPIVLAACACARPSLAHVRAGEERPRRALETAEAWARGEATVEEVRAAAVDASASAYYGVADAITYAIYAAYHAAGGGYCGADYAADAANAAGEAPAASAKIVREMLPCPVLRARGLVREERIMTDRNGIEITKGGYVRGVRCPRHSGNTRLAPHVRGYECQGCATLYSASEVRKMQGGREEEETEETLRGR